MKGSRSGDCLVEKPADAGLTRCSSRVLPGTRVPWISQRAMRCGSRIDPIMRGLFGIRRNRSAAKPPRSLSPFITLRETFEIRDAGGN
ncbi:MAG: hypothetical protein ACTHKH_05620, partial [Trinickia sp.]